MGTMRRKTTLTVRVPAAAAGGLVAATTLTGCNGITVAPDHVLALSR